MKAIVLDLDGTLADFYSVRGWLEMLQAENAAPYLIAKPLGDYKKLNGLLAALQGYGYAVFGRVTKGMDIVNRIAKVKTGQKGMHADVPVNPVVIEQAQTLKSE